jgi:CDP-glucose 4,6-dehydratase
LQRLGADVTGYALPPSTDPSLFQVANVASGMKSVLADIRDLPRLTQEIVKSDPEVVFHLAAQPLVRASYMDPVETYSTNVLGTVNLFEAVRACSSVRAVVNITSDKAYENREWVWGYRETDPMGGYDPYSSSKGCAELVTAAYRRSFNLPLASARAGNVIGGGDWSADRIVPDLWRAQRSGVPVALRYPQATRPWQHVLEPVAGYLDYAEALAAGSVPVRALNFGPPEENPVPVRAVAEAFQKAYGAPDAKGWTLAPGEHPKEAPTLAIDARLAASMLPWKPRLPAAEAIEWTARWYVAFDQSQDIRAFTEGQIAQFEDRR